ncbi:peptidylprolyl isomerase [Thiocystis minor]|uniref:SurA N-terminal domain-containing protein n=1 Tax=Thiocystis minor TaxID=61597 RepID=UPI00191214E7|nr:SurA N-terminal domain-containing protein [Thiocystis minor]MBK5964271.1 peptidylprolyl isomerase [Thiocystis minor]
MLQTIRDRAQGWIAWVIVVLISVPFALWGIQSYLGVGGEPIAAKINGVEIPARDLDRRVQEARIELRERLGAAYDLAEFTDKQLRAEVLDEMVREVLLLDATRRLGLRVSDREIQLQVLSESAFQKDGRFDQDSYERILELQGMTPALFEARLRQQMTGTQLVRAVSGSEFVTRSELSQYQRLAQQKRELTYARFPVADFSSTEPIDETAITAYYESNAARFQTPEQVKLDYLILDASTLSGTAEIGEEELRRHYDDDQARFSQPERRKVGHLLLSVPSDADEAVANQVLSEIKAVRDRILAGESMDELAKQLSNDPGSAAKGGSLGMIEKGVMVPAFEQVAFTLPVGELSEPVRTQFGYHLIRVDEIVPSVVKPFEEVRDQLRAELAKQSADTLFYELGERLANLVYESPDSLESAAEELGLDIQQSDWIGREGGEGILGQPKVLAAAFSNEVLVEGNNSDLIEPERDSLQAIVLRVVEHRLAATKPLDEVREEIIAEIGREKARLAAQTAAESAVSKLRDGADWAATLGTLKLEEPGLVDRQATSVPAPILDTAFTLPAPSEGSISVGTAALDHGDAAVVRLIRVQDGEIKSEEAGQTAPEASMLSQLMARQLYADMLRDMESRANIERKAVSSVEDL